jgi:choline dehydrogenase-like flavoprotein
MRSAYRRVIAVQGPVQEMPVFDSRVQVDPTVRDAWGIPVARLSGDKHPHSLEIARYIAGKAEQWLKEAGAVQTWKKIPGRGLSAGQHQAGTCRMGNDPKTSVVNKFHRAHDVPNLFIVDGSNLVTGGRNHPTMTIQALAFRAADNIIRNARRGTLNNL